MLGPLKINGRFGQGSFAETAFFHKSSKTLLVTDSIVKVPTEPPEIVTEDPSGLLFHARDNYLDEVADTAENRRKGWRRTVQFGLTF